MGQLAQAKEREKLFLPHSSDKPEAEQDWVVFESGEMTAGDMMAVTDETQGVAVMYAVLAVRIVEWSFTKPDGSPEPITVDAIKRLPVEDFTFLAEKITATPGLTDDERLKSPEQSQPVAINVQ